MFSAAACISGLKRSIDLAAPIAVLRECIGAGGRGNSSHAREGNDNGESKRLHGKSPRVGLSVSEFHLQVAAPVGVCHRRFHDPNVPDANAHLKYRLPVESMRCGYETFDARSHANWALKKIPETSPGISQTARHYAVVQNI
jgi:hypothetical protein